MSKVELKGYEDNYEFSVEGTERDLTELFAQLMFDNPDMLMVITEALEVYKNMTDFSALNN
jgi:hypothetical protein